MRKLTLASGRSDVLPQIFIEKYKILFIIIKSQFEIAKAFSCRMPPIMYGSTIYMFESIRIFKLLRQSIRQNSRIELRGYITHKLYFKYLYSINVAQISFRD